MPSGSKGKKVLMRWNDYQYYNILFFFLHSVLFTTLIYSYYVPMFCVIIAITTTSVFVQFVKSN